MQQSPNTCCAYCSDIATHRIILRIAKNEFKRGAVSDSRKPAILSYETGIVVCDHHRTQTLISGPSNFLTYLGSEQRKLITDWSEKQGMTPDLPSTRLVFRGLSA